MEKSWAAAVGTAAPFLPSAVPAPRPGSPSPPVPLTPTLPNPICKLATRRPRPGPHPRSPNSRRRSTVSSSCCARVSRSRLWWRGLKKPGVGRRPQSEPWSGGSGSSRRRAPASSERHASRGASVASLPGGVPASMPGHMGLARHGQQLSHERR
nr:translation initiation factor IF-2-like [Rattus norvegicus]